jgi:hypothetical protein
MKGMRYDAKVARGFFESASRRGRKASDNVTAATPKTLKEENERGLRTTPLAL